MCARLLAGVVFACAFVLAAPASQAGAEQQHADARIVALLERADKASLALKLDEALARIDEGLSLAEQIKDRVGLAMAFRMKGLAFSRLGRPQEARTWYGKALSEFEAISNRQGIAQGLTGLAVTSQALGDVAKAKEYGARALKTYEELGDDGGRAFVLRILAEYEPIAQQSARYREILEIAGRLNDVTLKATALRMLGAGEFRVGNLDEARKSFEGAIAAYESTGDIESLAACYLNLGRIYRAHGDYDGALVRYQKAIDLLAPTKERFTIVEAWNSKAIALGYLGRRQEGLAATETGLALARESGNPRLIDFMEGNLAGSLGTIGEHERAIGLLREIIARKPEAYLAPYRFYSLGLELHKVGRFAEAVGPMNEAIRLSREQKVVESLGIRLDGRAALLSSLGRLEEALADRRESLAIVEQIRTRLIPTDFLKQGYGDRVQGGYLQIVDLLSQMGRATEALEAAEQGRARAFLDLLAARATTDPALTTRGEMAGSSSTAGLTSDSAGRPVGSAEMGAIAKRLNSTVVSYWVTADATLAWVVRPDGEPKHVRIPITRQKLAALVSGTTAPLNESAKTRTTRGADETPASVGEPNAPAEDLTALPLRGLGLLALSRDDKAVWRELYKTLIEPVRAHLPLRGSRITIVPHGPLFQLSFAALQSPAGRYLIEDYELHFAPAVSALAFTDRLQRSIAEHPAGPWAIVGNPTTLPTVGSRALAPLPGAAREIGAIAAIAPKGKAIRLDGKAATETALAKTLDGSRPSVLHFATHGFVFDDPKVPAFLALDRQGTTASEDGRLTVDEVYGLRLSTDLVVLSACRSGSGQVSSDGIVGLTRGFFYAGTPSVMATYWDVTDETTAILMTSFYRSYGKAGAKSASLRSAQLALLANLRAGKVVVTASGRRVTLPEHPLLWAAFFLSGEP